MSISQQDILRVITLFSTPNDVVNLLATNKEFKSIDNNITWNLLLMRDYGISDMNDPRKLYMTYYKLFNEIEKKWKSPHSYSKMLKFMNYVCKNTKYIHHEQGEIKAIGYTINAMILFMKGFDCDIKLFQDVLLYSINEDIIRELFELNNNIIYEVSALMFLIDIIPNNLSNNILDQINININKYALDYYNPTDDDITMFNTIFGDVYTNEDLYAKMESIIKQPSLVLYINNSNRLDYYYIPYNIDALENLFFTSDYTYDYDKSILKQRNIDKFGEYFYDLKDLYLNDAIIIILNLKSN